MKPDIDRCSSRSEVVISDEVYQTAGLPREELQRKEITVRGRTAPIVMRTVFKAENSRDTGCGRFRGGNMKSEQPERNCKSFTVPIFVRF